MSNSKKIDKSFFKKKHAFFEELFLLCNMLTKIFTLFLPLLNNIMDKTTHLFSYFSQINFIKTLNFFINNIFCIKNILLN